MCLLARGAEDRETRVYLVTQDSMEEGDAITIRDDEVSSGITRPIYKRPPLLAVKVVPRSTTDEREKQRLVKEVRSLLAILKVVLLEHTRPTTCMVESAHLSPAARFD